MYKCHQCGKVFAQMTHDGCCDEPLCFGEPLIPMGGGLTIIDPPENTVEGLCVLVCDISGSMDEPAFANHPAEKLKIIVGAIHKAIAELQSLARADTAYIAIVAFGEKAGLVLDANDQPFVKSVSQIMREYGEYAAKLPGYLYNYFKEDTGQFGRGATNMTEALQVARAIYDATLAGNLSALGIDASAKLIEHSDIVTQSGQAITVPNIRVMIYSDGGHTVGTLSNAFDGTSPSPLMTAFIGDENESPGHRLGADQMRMLANTCPEHGQKGYFLINAPERHAVLRNLFRMASGASGFCPQCLRRQFGTVENVAQA